MQTGVATSRSTDCDDAFEAFLKDLFEDLSVAELKVLSSDFANSTSNLLDVFLN